MNGELHGPRARTLGWVAALALWAPGCEGGGRPSPSELCDWVEECQGTSQGCEKTMVDIYRDAAQKGCSEELGEMFSCAIELDCDTDGTECQEESVDYSNCITGAL